MPGETQDESLTLDCDQGIWSFPPSAQKHFESLIKSNRGAEAHEIFYDVCQQVYSAKNLRVESSSILFKKGLEKIEAATAPQSAASISADFDYWKDEELPIIKERRLKRIQLTRDEVPGDHSSEEIVMPNSSLAPVMNLIQKALTRELTGKMEQAMGSHFRLDHFVFSRTHPSKDPAGSFRWHRDTAPSAQLHLMIYLTDSGEDHSGGGTFFIDREQTKTCEKNGYSFPNIKDRTMDLSATEKNLSIYSPAMKAGDGLLFFANQVLHCGIPPKSGFRDAMILIFLPSLNPWNEVLTKFDPKIYLSRQFGRPTIEMNPLGF